MHGPIFWMSPRHYHTAALAMGIAEERVRWLLEDADTTGLVAGGIGVKAAVIYTHYPNAIEITHFGVRPEYRRRGWGRALMDRLKLKLGHTRHTLICDVPDDNLPAHLFLQACGFSAEPHGDVYRFIASLYPQEVQI